MRFIGYWVVYFVLILCAVVGFTEICDVINSILIAGLASLGGKTSNQVSFFCFVLPFAAFFGAVIASVRTET